MRIVIDGAGDVPEEYVEKYGIIVVPINITFGTEEYLSGITLDHEAFYKKVEQVGNHNFPKTAQPTPYQFAELYRKIMAEGESEILTITVGEKLSGTYASAVMAQKELEGQANITIFDSMSGSAAQGYMAMEAARLLEAGVGREEIMSCLVKMRDEQVIFFLIDSLDYAVKGGRVSSLKSTMASLLRIKPIIKLQDGQLVEAGTVRTYKKALDSIVDSVVERVGDKAVKLAYIHANDPGGVVELQKRAREKLNIAEEISQNMAISVAINLGPGAVGIVAIPV